MVTIRLTRRGARNQPYYHVVVTDHRKRQGGKSRGPWTAAVLEDRLRFVTHLFVAVFVNRNASKSLNSCGVSDSARPSGISDNSD